MGNLFTSKPKPENSKPPVKPVITRQQREETFIKHVEENLLISWTAPITKQWFKYHLISCQKQQSNATLQQLLQSYISKLCVEYGFDGYGISLMNEEFFMKISFNIIDELKQHDITRFKHVITYLHRTSNARLPLDLSVIEIICSYTIYRVKSIIQSFYKDHIIRVQEHFSKEFPAIPTKLQNEPNIEYLEQIIAAKDDNMQYKLLEWFHYQTEHRLGYYSRTQSRIWILQPSTCKRYYGLIKLIPLQKYGTLADLQNKENNIDLLYKSILFSNKNEPKQLSFESISCFIWYSLSLSSSKDSFHNFSMPKGAFSKRVNASSGGLHPVECYFILPSSILDKDIKNQWFFCHYPVRQHALEILGSFETKNINNKMQKVTNNVFYILVSAVDFRETWKYGERGLRYSFLDIGHGLGALCIICNLMGWKCQIAANVSFNELQSKFDLPKADHPRILLKIDCCNSPSNDNYDIDILSSDCVLNKKESITEYYAELSDTWPILGIVEKHCLLETVDEKDVDNEETKENKWIDCNIDLNVKDKDIFSDYCVPANYALRHRRSALEFDIDKGKFNMFRDACFLMKNIKFPFKKLCCYILYVIRIENIESGMYLLFPKHATKYENIYKEYIEKTTKQKDNGIELMNEEKDGDLLCIYQHEKMDEESVAKMSKHMACHQNLCSNASFTIDFCVDLDIAMKNGYNYSISHWECGFIGQLLYMHIESVGLGTCAIGCYLDDYASSNVGFIPKTQKNPNHLTDDNEDKLKISPIGLKRFDDFDHPFKNIRSLCHFSCGTPSTDLRYPYYAWEHELFPFNE